MLQAEGYLLQVFPILAQADNLTRIRNISEKCSLDVYSNAVIVMGEWISDCSLTQELLMRFASAVCCSKVSVNRIRSTD